jgi:hypothetical protein
MRLRRVSVVFVVVALLAVVGAAGCGDDDSDETRAGGTTTTTEPDTSASEPGGGAVPSRPAELTGTVTDHQGGRYLVEEQPDSPDTGRKAWVTVDGPVFHESAGDSDAPSPATASDIGQGQQVSVWTDICAQSYPEQCAAEALLIH